MHSEVHEGRPARAKEGRLQLIQQLIKFEKIKQVNIPRKEYYRLEEEYAKAIARTPELKDYFPHYGEQQYTPSR